MTLPLLTPSSRQFDPGNWPVRTYNSQNGSEIRLLYGSQRFNLTLNLTYNNIADSDAELFLDDYISKNGTYKAFTLTTAEANALFNGWAGAPTALREPAGVEWRYDEPPKIESVIPGVSTVQIVLRGVI
jgi:hypothetical protein